MSKEPQGNSPPAPTQEQIDRLAEAEEAASVVDQQAIASSVAGSQSEDPDA